MNGASLSHVRYQSASPSGAAVQRARRRVAVLAALVIAALLSLLYVSWILPTGSLSGMCAKRSLYPGKYGREAERNLTAFRSGVLARVVPQFARKELSDKELRYSRYDPFPAVVTCPPGRGMARYGGIPGNAGEGGKLLCDLAALRPPCVIYSMGSKGDYSFERSVLSTTPCSVHTFDCTYDGKSIDRRHSYHKICVGNEPSRKDFMMYADIPAMLHHKAVDLLKVDIEGHEFKVMGGWKEGDASLPAQIVAELHFHTVEEEKDLATTVAKALPHMSLLFMHLANLGYAAVMREDNMNANLGCCAEYTFLRVQA